jgi:hypothetical protein
MNSFIYSTSDRCIKCNTAAKNQYWKRTSSWMTILAGSLDESSIRAPNAGPLVGPELA